MTELSDRMAQAVAHADTFPVWPDGEAPGARQSHAHFTLEEQHTGETLLDRAVTGVRAPQITVYQPDEPNGIGLLVMPGGSYRRVVLDKEGSALAPAFTDAGYTLFVMAYRLPGDGHAEGADAPLADAQRALRLVRHRAAEFGVTPEKIGVLGFSAGGHVAASLATRYDEAISAQLDDIDHLSARPAFLALGYPVISMTPPIAHAGSRQQLLGEDPDSVHIKRYSPEQSLPEAMPPTFLFHAVDDPSVKVENSLAMFSALREKGVAAELHLFEEGGHGFGIRDAEGLPAQAWPQLLMRWLARKLENH
ncbi:xylanase [Franconibacter daqui]|uniref:alpha/beta hydrolase n=1 Tax=Franconibacter daqui TaxID=2047724 RepID=UPI001667F7A0|nr:alpha/beta hydrolase [Franconibacter daqui]GGD18239.1 xylanase [Franconibacter daqui]